MNLNELAKQVHAANEKWWTCMDTGKPIERNKGELLMLVITELSEAVEGIRKDLMDDKLPHRKMEEVEMADAKIRLLDFAAGFEIGKLNNTCGVDNYFQRCENKAECILLICAAIQSAYNTSFYKGIRCADNVSRAIQMIDFYCDRFQLDLDGALREKMDYNRSRVDHSHEARKLAGGKKF